MRKVARELSPPAMRPLAKVCIVLVCTDKSEAEHVCHQLAEFDNGCLVAYRRVEDLKYNAPAGSVALILLANDDAPSSIRRTLGWLRNRWPRCPVAVVGDAGCGDHEMAARQGGAMYLTRPVADEEWAAILGHVLGSPRRSVEETRERFEA